MAGISTRKWNGTLHQHCRELFSRLLCCEALANGEPRLVVKKTNDLSYIQWFLDHGADPDAACLTDTTSLSIAVQWGALPVIKLLFERTSAPYRGQLLHRAAFRTREDADEVLKLVFSRCPEDINRIINWHQPLPYAMYREGGLGTPLHNVAQQGKVGAARILLDGGADASLKNSVGMTALRVAERAGNAEVAQVLRALEE